MKNLISNTATIAYRNLLKTLHNPDKLLDVIVQPVLFMLMFGYLFGGAIAGNVHTGIYNRFKSLPISNLAPLAGQLVADILRLVVAAIASLATGYLMGWRPAAGLGWVVIVVLLDVFLGWAISWIFAFYGLIAKSTTMVESISLMTMLILIFLSNAFVPVKTLPNFMKVVVHLNPVTYVISASRTMLNQGIWSNEAWIVFGAGVLIIAIFGPLTVLVYNHKS